MKDLKINQILASKLMSIKINKYAGRNMLNVFISSHHKDNIKENPLKINTTVFFLKRDEKYRNCICIFYWLDIFVR